MVISLLKETHPSTLFWVVMTGLVTIKVLLPVSQIFFTYLIAKRYRSKRSLLKGAGEWAIVTGGSDGIGKGFAMELAKEGLNILLLSNDIDGLEKTCEEIEDRFSVETAKIVVDFTEVDGYDRIRDVIDKLSSVACLVNNVGMFRFSKDYVIGVDRIDWEKIIDPIKCNCIPTACMTRIVLRKMLRQTSPGRAIINISSHAANHCSPYMSIYSATKAFVLHFSNCLTVELKETGILVQAFQPSLVSTALSKAKPSWRVPVASTYAKCALDMLGVEKNSYGYLVHAVHSFVIDLLPSEFIWRWKMKAMKSILVNHAETERTTDMLSKKQS